MARVIAAATFCCLIFSACSHQPAKPKHLLAEDTYINLLVELQMLKTYSRYEGADSTQIDSLQKAIFAKYAVSRTQFSQSQTYYQQQVGAQNGRIKKAIENLRKDHAIKTDSIAQADSTMADSANKP